MGLPLKLERSSLPIGNRLKNRMAPIAGGGRLPAYAPTSGSLTRKRDKQKQMSDANMHKDARLILLFKPHLMEVEKSQSIGRNHSGQIVNIKRVVGLKQIPSTPSFNSNQGFRRITIQLGDKMNTEEPFRAWQSGGSCAISSWRGGRRNEKTRSSDNGDRPSSFFERTKWERITKPKISTPSEEPPLGRLLWLLKPDDFHEESTDPKLKPIVTECQTVASFSWLDAAEPTIAVPG